MERGSIQADGVTLVPRAGRARHFHERLRGLLGRGGLPAGCGLLIGRCGAVHTVGMRFALDLVFLDGEGRVTRVVAAVSPGRLLVSGGRRARQVLEVAAGWLALDDLAGARLVFVPAAAGARSAASQGRGLPFSGRW